MLTRPTGADAAIFQALLEHSPDAIVLVDARGVVRFASRATEHVLG